MEPRKYFVLKLVPSRPSFAFDMSPEEKDIMQKHVAYWASLLQKGSALVFGPVMDPAGVYGLGIVAVDHEDEVKLFIQDDPASAINRYEYYPMRAVTATTAL
jgi:uncharacterized protein